jgi:hypothetical protein
MFITFFSKSILPYCAYLVHRKSHATHAPAFKKQRYEFIVTKKLKANVNKLTGNFACDRHQYTIPFFRPYRFL